MKRMILVMTSFGLAACASSVQPAVVEPVDKLAEIQAHGTLVIATDADYVPQSRLIMGTEPAAGTKCEPTQYAANQFEGFDVDVAKAVADRLGVEPCFVTPPWSQLVAGNWGDNWDVHAGSVAFTYDRMDDLYFTQPYYATPTVLLVHKENTSTATLLNCRVFRPLGRDKMTSSPTISCCCGTSYKTPEDLSGKRIGICAGCTFEAYLQGTLKIPGEGLQYRIQNARAIAFESEDPAIKALSIGDGVELDAVMTIMPKARAAVDSGIPVKILDEPVLFAYASITLDRAGQRDSGRLFKEINRIIQEMHQAGKLRELSLRYQGMDFSGEAALYDISILNQPSLK